MLPEKKNVECPDCEQMPEGLALDRRGFLRGVVAATAATATGGLALPSAMAAPTPKSAAETAVKNLYETLTEKQKKEICFEWDHMDKARGLLRTHVSNNWHITKPTIDSNFFTKEQQALALDVFKSIFNPDWHARLFKQLKDDTGGRPWGAAQNIAIFGKPGSGKFELVMTGRHLTCRADGDSEAHVALGGPIFHGHAASGFNEKVHHPGNVFWHQALAANKVYQVLSDKQQKQALVAHRPAEAGVSFRGPKGKFPGIPLTELSRDQKAGVQKVLTSLLEPYRKEDHDEVMACLKAQGGLDACSLAFYKDGDIGDDSEWDNWRLEGPSFVWYFRGHPHVHIWINVADDPAVKLNARG
jgi:Protein of unknown function (DUF3500)